VSLSHANDGAPGFQPTLCVQDRELMFPTLWILVFSTGNLFNGVNTTGFGFAATLAALGWIGFETMIGSAAATT
jgi:hypothetical protein